MKGTTIAEVEAQEERLGLPPGFYFGLLEEDDWSFVIKLNALVEAACTDALVARLHSPELIEPLRMLDLGHAKYGKIALLSALGAVEPQQATVLRLLLELRNLLAHNVSQVSFSFEAYVAGLDKNQRKQFVAKAGHGVKPNVGDLSRHDFTLQNPKAALWTTVHEILACLHLEHDVAAIRLHSVALKILAGSGVGPGA